MLLFWRKSNIAEQEDTIQERRVTGTNLSRQDSWTANLVERVMDLSKLGWCKVTRMDAFDLPTKVDKVRGIRGGRKWKGAEFDSHLSD